MYAIVYEKKMVCIDQFVPKIIKYRTLVTYIRRDWKCLFLPYSHHILPFSWKYNNEKSDNSLIFIKCYYYGRYT